MHIKLGMPPPIAIPRRSSAGAAIGAWHGLWVGWLGVPAFVVTLAGFKAFRGGALVLSQRDHAAMATTSTFLRGNVPASATWAIVARDARGRHRAGRPRRDAPAQALGLGR